MAFQLNDTSYSGKYSADFIIPALYSMDTIEKNTVYVKDGIKKLYTIRRMNYEKPLKPRMAVPVTDNKHPFVLDGRQIIPKSVDIYEEVNPRDLEETENSELLSQNLLDRELPDTIENRMIELLLGRAAEEYERGLWMGSLAYAGRVDDDDDRYQIQYFNGFMQRMVNDPLINLSGISPVNITKANILTILNDLISQALSKKKGLMNRKGAKNRMKFLMSPLTEGIYLEQLRDTTFKGVEYDTGVTPRYGGYQVVSLAGMPDNTILFMDANDDEKSNLWVGMNSMGDWNVRVGKTRPQDELVFMQAKFKWDVQYGWSQEIFMYTTLVPNNFIVP